MGQQTAPFWMRAALTLAGLQNLAWAVTIIFFPTDSLHLIGLGTVNYPEMWQFVGMLVGSIGIGYLIAGSSPLRHWPIILVGAIGKFLAPLGFANAWLHGRLPLSLAVTLVTNDLLWWLPFGFMLHATYLQHREKRRRASPDVLPMAMRARTEDGQTLDELSRENPVLLVFLRHAGCPFCREALSDLARQRRRIERMGIQIVLVHMGSSEQGREMAARYRLDDLSRVSDPHQTIYRGFGLARGNMRELYGPGVIWRGWQVLWKGYRVGRFIGDIRQMPGLFLLFHGEVLRSFRHQTIAERADLAAFTNVAADSDL